MANEDGKEDLHFRYSREERLRRSSEAVRRLNDPASRRRPSLLRTLAPNRASAFLLLGIFMLAATVLVSNLLVPPKNVATVAGNRLTLTAFRYQGGTYIAIKKKILREDAFKGPMDLTVHGDAETEVFTARRFVLGPSEEEDFRLSVDGEHRRLTVTISVGGARSTLTTEVE